MKSDCHGDLLTEVYAWDTSHTTVEMNPSIYFWSQFFLLVLICTLTIQKLLGSGS